MLDFTWTEEHKAVFKLVQDFGKKEVLPFIRERDRKEQFDPTILKKLGEADILGICIPSKYGGAGLDYISLGIACQELEYADTSLRVILSVHIGLTSLAYLTWGNEAQKQKYLVPQAKGEKIGSFGLTEPNAGSDVVGIQATADKKDGYYVLNGEKMWISLADVADNFLCVAWT
ncbi:MAG TPA: acyl-CoA dehydrogenase family protein, partial [candidate division Zixibacteria bacterium]|nr:acyl-CoA dehydrogenase family protein [candidate division Zixibacteria bacterium]